MKHSCFSFYYSILSGFLLIFISSCGSKKDIVYFQNSEKYTSNMYYQERAEFKTVIMPNDNLFISVSSPNQESVKVFNSAPINQAGNITAAMLDISGYLVNHQGNINFPLVGEIHVAGMTKEDVIQLLQKEISKFVEGPVPVINIRFLNYKISVIGEVNRPGEYTISDEKISIPRAIALAGDLTIYGDRHNVQLIRMDKNGENQIFFFDLTTPDLFFSPNYYLLQNDVLYIAPNKTKAGSSTYNQNLPLIVSLISVTITAVALFLRYN